MSLEKYLKFFTGKAKRRLTFVLSFWFLLVGGVVFYAYAGTDNAETDVSGTKSSLLLLILLDVMLLVSILICFFISVKVKSFLRDGELASGWSLFSISFVILFIAQLLSFSVDVNLTHISHNIISSVRLLSLLSLGSGIYFMKKVLS